MSKGIYVGSDKVSKLYWGTNEVKKIYKGSELVYESTPPATKGDIIRANLDGTYHNYLVAEITTTYTRLIDLKYKVGQWDSGTNNGYIESPVDLMLTEYYETFNDTAKNALKTMLISQSSYTHSSSGTKCTYLKKDNTVGYMKSGGTVSRQFRRKVFLLEFYAIRAYLNATTSMTSADTTLTYNAITNMLFGDNIPTSPSYVWLMDAYNTTPMKYIEEFNTSTGAFSYIAGNNDGIIFPQMCVDLSKIPYTIVTPSNT